MYIISHKIGDAQESSFDIQVWGPTSEIQKNIKELAEQLVPRQKEANFPIPAVDSIESHAGGVTIVRWKDGTYTSVRNIDHETNDIYTGFCVALTKKMMGSINKLQKFVDEHELGVVNAQREAEKQKRRDAEHRNHMKKVRAKAKQIRLEQEALQFVPLLTEGSDE